MRYVKLKRDIYAETGSGPVTHKLRAERGLAWELLEETDHEHSGHVAYLRSNPAGSVYVTDETDALEPVV